MPARRNEAGALHDAKGSLNNPDLSQPAQARRRFGDPPKYLKSIHIDDAAALADPRPAKTTDGPDRPESTVARRHAIDYKIHIDSTL